VACCYERIFRSPREGDVRKSGRLNSEDCRRSRVDDRDSRVVTSESEDISRGREANTMDPSASRAGILSADSIEGKLVTPDVGPGLLVNFLDVRREDSGLGVGTASSQKDVIGMPVDA